MQLIKPQKLQPGDRVATVSSSWGGPAVFPYRYDMGVKQLQDEFELEVLEMPYTRADPAWLQQNPQARAEDLMRAFADPSVKAIIASIGGDDSIRLLPFLDLAVIAANPKSFLGYSDSTVTHMACLKAGLGSFYGPSIMAGFAENGGLMPYMVDAVRRLLFSAEPPGEIVPNMDGWTVEFLDWADPENQAKLRCLNPCTGWNYLQGQGVHRGHLIGGCFESLDWLRGTDLWPAPEVWQGAILFIETSEEAPSATQVLRGLRSFAAMGVLAQLNGILFGRPGGPVPIDKFIEYDQAICQVVNEEQGLTELPIISNMDFGHTDPMLVLPYGVQAEIDCEQQRFLIMENAVVD